MPVTIDDRVYGDTSGALGRGAHGGDQALDLQGVVPLLTIIGDAQALLANAAGGDDTLSGFGFNSISILGDAVDLQDHAHGGSDVIGANARLTAAAFGDGQTLSDHAVGGADSITISARAAFAVGDARSLSGHARGGDDDIRVQAAMSSILYGDGIELRDHASGGDDTLSGGAGSDVLWGDAATVAPHARTGADLFIVTLGGHDQIMDFEPGKDRIELAGFGFGSFAELASHLQATGDGVLIALDANDDLLIRGVTPAQLGAVDFLFT